MSKIRVVMCPCDGRPPYVTNISDSLQNMQRIVHGYIEPVTLPRMMSGTVPVLVVNEEGLIKGLPVNRCFMTHIVGDAFICCGQDHELVGLPEQDATILLDAVKREWQLRCMQTPARYQ